MKEKINLHHALAITIKDLKDTFSSIAIYGPMIGIPIFFAIVLPIFTIYVSQFSSGSVISRILGYSAVASGPSLADKFLFIKYFAQNILGPIFLTMPIITATVIAADSFSGEKERRTAESLLTSPASNMELLIGKILASLIPAVILTIAVFVIYAGITNYMTASEFGAVIFPNGMWYAMLGNSPFLALTTIGMVVLISSRVKDIKEAQQISSVLVLPILIVPFVSVFNIAKVDTAFLLYMMALLICCSIALIFLSIRLFNREGFISS